MCIHIRACSVARMCHASAASEKRIGSACYSHAAGSFELRSRLLVSNELHPIVKKTFFNVCCVPNRPVANGKHRLPLESVRPHSFTCTVTLHI
uniref:Secreted protein n=1 Tax=Parascaris univalens TaxID=6257 RepID=A0A914ZRN9_PARUN